MWWSWLASLTMCPKLPLLFSLPLLIPPQERVDDEV
jgi:hypothetical protein